MVCPNCKNNIDDDSRFCRFCGVEFIGEEQVISVTQEEADGFAELPQRPQNVIAPQKARDKKKVTAALVATVALLAVICAVLLVVGLGSGKIGSSAETITDAAGETVKEGKGTVEISVRDTDGTIREIKSDKSLLTPSSILEEYTAVMNRLKTDSPAFTRIKYQNLPTDHQSLGAVANIVLPIIEKYVTSKTAAKLNPYSAGNADKLPLENSSYGCLLTDAEKIKNAYCEILEDGDYRLVITVNDEANPPILSAGASSTQSAVSGIFDPYDAAEQISAIAELALSNITFNYTDCTVSLIYDYGTKQVRSAELTMNIDIEAEILKIPINARIVDVTEYSEFGY